MSFVKYEVESKPSIDVRISANGITISQSALAAFGLSDTSYVNLWWDGETHAIGISASSPEDKSAFKIAVRGRGQGSKFIAASRFFEKFGINADTASTNGALKESDGVAAFELDLPVIEKKPYTGKPRGRKPKNANVTA